MKYAAFFAGSASAYAVASSYPAAAPSYPAAASTPSYPVVTPSSAAPYPVQNNSVPAYAASSTKPAPCSAVVTPGYGQAPVTITAQYQTYPSCVATAYGGSSCATWGANTYVSTTVKDYNSQNVYVTDVKQAITLYATKSTSTCTAAGSSATPSVYQRVEYCQYNQLGGNAINGYGGSGLCATCCNAQPVTVKEYKNGQWSSYTSTQSYGVPTAYATTYATPGTYTVPAKQMTVSSTVYGCSEVTKTATAGQTCVYGGNYALATGVGYMTVPYGGYSTSVSNNMTSTYPVVKTTTVYASKTGTVTICTPTSTVYATSTTYVYPMVSSYAPGVYSYGAKTVTVTQSNQAYTCPYENRIYPVTSMSSKPTGYPAKPVSAYPTGAKPSVPSYPMKGTSIRSGKPAKSTPCTLETKVRPTSSMPANNYGYSVQPVSTPAGYAVKPVSTPVYPVYPAQSTPCTLEKKPSPTAVYPVNTPGYPAASSPVYPVYPAASSPVYPVYPAASSPAGYAQQPAATPVYNVASTPAGYAQQPAATPAYPAQNTPASGYST